MDPESKKLLEETLRLSQENNTMLHSMKRSQRMASIMRAVYWTLIILSSFGAYYFVQPYISQIIGVYGGGAGDILDKLDQFKQN